MKRAHENPQSDADSARTRPRIEPAANPSQGLPPKCTLCRDILEHRNPFPTPSALQTAPTSRAPSQAPSLTAPWAPTRLPSTPSSMPRPQAPYSPAFSPTLRRPAAQPSHLRSAVGINSSGAIPTSGAAPRIPKEISDNFLRECMQERMQKIEDEVYLQGQTFVRELEEVRLELGEMRVCVQAILLERDAAHTTEPTHATELSTGECSRDRVNMSSFSTPCASGG